MGWLTDSSTAKFDFIPDYYLNITHPWDLMYEYNCVKSKKTNTESEHLPILRGCGDVLIVLTGQLTSLLSERNITQDLGTTDAMNMSVYLLGFLKTTCFQVDLKSIIDQLKSIADIQSPKYLGTLLSEIAVGVHVPNLMAI